MPETGFPAPRERLLISSDNGGTAFSHVMPVLMSLNGGARTWFTVRKTAQNDLPGKLSDPSKDRVMPAIAAHSGVVCPVSAVANSALIFC